MPEQLELCLQKNQQKPKKRTAIFETFYIPMPFHPQVPSRYPTVLCNQKRIPKQNKNCPIPRQRKAITFTLKRRRSPVPRELVYFLPCDSKVAQTQALQPSLIDHQLEKRKKNTDSLLTPRSEKCTICDLKNWLKKCFYWERSFWVCRVKLGEEFTTAESQGLTAVSNIDPGVSGAQGASLKMHDVDEEGTAGSNPASPPRAGGASWRKAPQDETSRAAPLRPHDERIKKGPEFWPSVGDLILPRELQHMIRTWDPSVGTREKW